MKKIIALFVVLCIVSSLFASGTVKVGGSFNFVNGKTRDFEVDGKKQEKSAGSYKTNGWGFDVSGNYDISDNLLAWADFDMVFAADAELVDGASTLKLNDLYKTLEEAASLIRKAGGVASTSKKINVIHFAAGLAYKIAVEAVDLKLGGGLFYERGLASIGFVAAYQDEKTETSIQLKTNNIGIALYADATYKFSENFGAGITLMPSIGLFNVTTLSLKNNEETKSPKAKGFAIGFSMPIVLGVSYSF